MRRLSVLFRCAFGALLLSACESRPPVAGGCAFTYECSAGSVCRDGLCVEISVEPIDSGSSMTTDAGPLPTDAGAEADAGVDAGAPPDAGLADAGTRLTFAPGAYRKCRDDLECAVFGGNCVVELTLSRPTDGGVDRVRVSDIDPSFAMGEGVCTLPCTSDPRICDSITVMSPAGASAPFTCQVVYAATSPYPAPAPAFPFDAQLDPVALARGVPFASVCRPPFQFSLSHSENFCQACTQDMQCGATGACFLERAASTPRSGSCVESCSPTQPCAFGFSCQTLPGSTSTSTFCVPTAGTCGRCRDSDGDLRGTGRCGPLTQPNTGVDCDDSNAVAYFDQNNPRHAFPASCGNTDVNCNGKSDETEQLGSEDHCSACGDVCVGRVGEIANSRRACLARSSAFACVADCDVGYADCDGDVSNGCEQQLGSNSIYAEDLDGDGRGSPTNFRYVCTGTAPTGWVQNRLDCNDGNATIFGGDGMLSAGPELCDGLDNNCNGIPDDPGFIVSEGSSCNTGVPGVCAPGTRRCDTVSATADAGASASFACVGVRNPVTQAAVAESCDGLDNNCNGQTDESLDYFESQGQQNPRGSGAPAPCPIANGKGICAQGVYACTTTTNPLADGGTLIAGAWACQGTTAQPTDAIDDLAVDTNCDGTDGDLSTAVFVRPIAGAGSLDGKDSNDGTSQRPVATVQRALALACAGGPPCRDIYLAAAEFSSNAPIAVPTFTAFTAVNPVRIYGGFDANVVCSAVACDLVWTRGTNATTLTRQAPARAASIYPFSPAYAAIQAAPGSGPLRVLLDQLIVQTRAPDATSFLQNGEHAPAQIGFTCPARGCGELVFRNLAINVDAAINGGDGAAGAAGPVGNLNGGDGCDPNSNCSGVPFVNGQWMQYTGPSTTALALARADNTVGRAVAGCPDGQRNNGGWSAAFRYEQVVNMNRLYEFQGEWGGGWNGGYGGSCVKWNDQPTNTCFNPARAGNGSGGAGAFHSGSLNFRLNSTGELMAPAFGLGFSGAGHGTSGGGGGGGGGCIVNSSFFTCPAGELRGGGGGAGGCGGFAAGTGGQGGSVLGLVLVGVAAQDVNLSTSGAFRVTVGNSGRGGHGGRGGSGAAGGYGGLAPNRHPHLNGGHGGDGGGGGGGAGGIGGSSIGIFRHCLKAGGTLANGCGIVVPPALLAAPGSFVTVGTAGGPGNAGAAGAFAAKPTDFNGRTDSSTPVPGGAGGAGVAGRADTLYFNY